MEFEDVERVNELFREFYPYIARQIAEEYGRVEGLALEVGPYAPGISVELARMLPGLKIVVGDDRPETNEYIRGYISAAGISEGLEVREIDKFHIPFDDGTFDLIYFRGALFFWEDAVKIAEEAERVLNTGGLAMLGGGFGADAPEELIERYAEESRELNRRLGKASLTEEMGFEILYEAGLSGFGRLDLRHGMWLIFRK